MNPVLIKIFATALAMSQVTAAPDKIKTEFDSVRDREAVAQLLRNGCTQMRKAFDIEDVNLDDLIATAMEDPQAMAGEVKAFKGVDFNDLFTAYKEFCRNEKVANSPVDLGEVIVFYNNAMKDLPDNAKLKGLRPSGAYQVLDGKGERYTEVFEAENRRIWVPLKDIPEHVQKAFVAAEDKRFYQHKGVDERGIIRAFITNIAQPGRPQGGSTITQQVVKNLLVGDDVTYERKMREMVVASRLEGMISKQEILELYLNAIYLGRGSWGVEMAARSYFGKSAKDLTIAEGALLAGITKGPNFYNPERHPDRAQERVTYVLGRMQADSMLSAAQVKEAGSKSPQLVAYERVRRDSGFHFVDQIAREAKSVGLDQLNAGSMVVKSTINPQLQRAAETALQDGLARYEASTGRARFMGPETNLADAIGKLGADRPSAKPAWQQALETARLPLYDVHWTPAIVLGAVKGQGLRVGLADGRVLPLAGAARKLQTYDVVYVRASAKAGRAELRIRPIVQGAAIVLDNNTGAILAMTGGFSYPLSQLNRATQSQRQPGSTLKPFTYLAALRKGIQPNTIVRDTPLTLPPIYKPGNATGSNSSRLSIMVNSTDKDFWTPKNYSGYGGGVTTLRRALENSKNLVTANLLDGVIDYPPEDALTRVCELTQEAQVYKECMRYYPFVLGAQPARLVDMAAFYAAIASEGARPAPHTIESVEQNGRTIFRHNSPPIWLGSADRVAFYQLKSILQGVVARGTANSIRHLAPYVAGKTGTSDNENDAWFVGFTNEVTVGVWVGYDNADGKRRTLGGGQTGAKVAIPIFEPIMQAVWANYAPRTALSGPSLVAGRQIAAVPIDLYSGDMIHGRGGGFTEYMRKDASGQLNDTQYEYVSREETYSSRGQAYGQDGDVFYANREVHVPQGFFVQPGTIFQQQRPFFGGLFGQQQPYYEQREVARQRQRRVDPDYFWGSRTR